MNSKGNLYDQARHFLLSIDGVTETILEQHLIPEYDKPDDLNTIYKRLCESAQNRQMSVKVIGGSIGGLENLSEVLFNFDPIQVSTKYKNDDQAKLLNAIIDQVAPQGKIRKTSRSIWPQFCKSVIDSAHFLSRFKDSADFYNWADYFSTNEIAKPALPLMISIEISGFGFPLACDFLKEIGYTEFGKPDVHIKKILAALGYIETNQKSNLKLDYETVRALDLIAVECGVTPFHVDKVLWLIGSGNFYRSGLEIGSRRDEFIEYMAQI
jgi:hypothetical protein